MPNAHSKQQDLRSSAGTLALFHELLTKRDWSRCAHVLIHLLIDHGLKSVGLHVLFIHDHSVMGRARRALNCRVRVQVKVVAKGFSDIAIDQGPWNRITVLVFSKTLFREEADVMTLLSNDDGEVDLCFVSFQYRRIPLK